MPDKASKVRGRNGLKSVDFLKGIAPELPGRKLSFMEVYSIWFLIEDWIQGKVVV